MSRNDWRRPQNFNTPPDKRRVKITVCYDGSEFCGWQSQNDLPSVQSTLKTCVQKFICSDNVIVVGSGRTDSGVHAKSQVAHIEFPGSCNVPAKAFMPALNALLPFSIRITESSEALPSFHARYSTMAREYRYLPI